MPESVSQPSEALISVVIPAYNYAHLLPRTLDSVLGQMAPDIELIVVNDGSRDQTAEVLAQYANRYPCLQVINQTNAGAAAARNNGIRKAQGRYVLLLDADDELLPAALEHLRKQLAETPGVGMILGGQISVFPDGKERLRQPTAIPKTSVRQLIQRYLLEKKISISHGCSLFRRDLLLQRPYPENLRKWEDIPVFAYLLASAPTAVTAHPLARIHKHDDSLRHNRENEEEYALRMVDAVFSSLPDDCQVLRRRYTAQRYLSLFRSAQGAGDRDAAVRHYRRAMQMSPYEALRWSYLRKRLRMIGQA